MNPLKQMKRNKRMVKIIYHKNSRFSFLFKSGDLAMFNGMTSWDSWETFFNDYESDNNAVKPAFYHFHKAYERDKRKKEVQLQLQY